MAPEEAINASGLAAVLSSGLRAFSDDGTWGKRVITGWACKAGITAAALARDGYPGTRDVLEKRWGLYSAFVGGKPCDLSELDKDLGVKWEVLGITMKRYPCTHGHESFIDSAIVAGRESGLGVEKIRCIRCHVSREANNWWFEPRSRKLYEVLAQPYGARFSLPYTIALGFHFGEVVDSHFDKAILEQRPIRELAELVTPQIDDTITDTNPNVLPGILEIETRDGNTLRFEGRERHAGDESRLVADKFRSNLTSVGLADSAESVLSSIRTIEECANIATLARLLRLRGRK
jgi:2-methylcitrate dehydratase PrpD